jgi:hypothetical protein
MDARAALRDVTLATAISDWLKIPTRPWELADWPLDHLLAARALIDHLQKKR